jgi:hypothetical protein
MSIPAARPQVLDGFGTPPVMVPSPGRPTGDAGPMPVRPFDVQTRLTQAFAGDLGVPRDPEP